jgi:hypothetical protein
MTTFVLYNDDIYYHTCELRRGIGEEPCGCPPSIPNKIYFDQLNNDQLWKIVYI